MSEQIPASDAQSAPERGRIGLAIGDFLRQAGLEAILSPTLDVATVDLRKPRSLDSSVWDLLIIDAALPEDLFDLLGVLRRVDPPLRVIVLGDVVPPEQIERVIGAGAKGYLNYTVREAEVLMAVEIVRDGSVWAPRKVLARLIEALHPSMRPAEVDPSLLTPRECEVLRLLIQGLGNREIAEALDVDAGTVKAHLGRLMRKAGVENRTALSIRAIEGRWLPEISNE